MTMPHIGAVFAAIAGVVSIMLHSSIHKIEEGHLAVYYRYESINFYIFIKHICGSYFKLGTISKNKQKQGS